MNILGISAGYHDAAATVISNKGQILFAGHSERYSRQKNDADIHIDIVAELGQYTIDHVAYYETPWRKQLRQLYSGQGIEWNRLTARSILAQQLHGFYSRVPTSTHSHHSSHAAGGFQTSPFDRATVVVIDAVGEFDTISIWGAEYDKLGTATYKKLWSQKYPHSIGLFYSACTGRIGLRPLDEEYITMGMSAYSTHGNVYGRVMQDLLLESINEIRFTENLHAGLDADFMATVDAVDIAGAAQSVVEQLINAVMQRAADFGFSSNLVYSGGVALNCRANRNLGDYFENIWIMPCPGDAGRSLGAAALAYGGRVEWRDAYLGHAISGPYPTDAVVRGLLRDRITGVASGRAEFGPRALGNRSLLADPRGPDIKDRVNDIKHRQAFRPFAPVILSEHADEFFSMPRGWHTHDYMQSVSVCRRPDLYPAIVHCDGTSRVQTVPDNGSGIRAVLESWYERTGCPMLLNTSLNVRGEPMVNTRADAARWSALYGVPVHT